MKATKPLEVIYIYVSASKIQEGDMMLFFALDEFSQFAFKPIIGKYPKDDQNLQENIRKLFKNIFKNKKPHHAKSSTIITNLPVETHSFINEITNNKHLIIFDPEKAEKMTKPILDEVFLDN